METQISNNIHYKELHTLRLIVIVFNLLFISENMYFSQNDHPTCRRKLDQVEEIRSELATENKNNVPRRKNWVAGLTSKGCGEDTIATHIQGLVR